LGLTLALGLGQGTTGRTSPPADPIKVLIITGDNVPSHDWQGTTKAMQEVLADKAKYAVSVTETPAKDLTSENLAKYDVLVLNYRDTKPGPDTTWTDANKKALLDAVKAGKGLVSHHFASAAFVNPNWEEYERAIAGGWRKQGYHGPKHEFRVKKTDASHPISDGAPAAWDHYIDELYSNSFMVPGSVVLATAYADPALPKGTGKDEPVVWVNQYGQGRVVNNVLGHDVIAMGDPKYREWFRRGVEWAATGKVAPK
jgi:type 1 glutamine amidotransferase